MFALNIPLSIVRFGIRCMVLSLYRVRVDGAENIPKAGGVLIICNHLSFMDGFLAGWAARHRNVRFMIWRPFYEHAVFGNFLRPLKAIPIGSTGPRDLVSAMKAARIELEAGHAVCIFAEGSVSRSGHLNPFKRGMERVIKDLDVPIVPMHLDHVSGGPASFKGGKFISRLNLGRWPITITVGKPLPAATTAEVVRQAVAELGSTAFATRKQPSDTLPMRFIRQARKQWGKFALADSTGRELTYGRALTASLLLAGVVRRRCAQQQMIGLLLPATAGGALANLGVALAGKVAVNLNFTAGKEAMELAIAQCKIQTVITSKVFLAKAKLEAPAGCVYLEDILASIGGAAKLWALVRARVAPKFALMPNVTPDSLATVIFSSGSTGVPKGVMLSHFNLISNIDAVLEIFWLDDRDRIIGTLPLFHSFGYMATIWLPLLAGCGVAYHPVPTDAKSIGELVEKYKGTFLLSTPTFCSTYMRKCTKQQFASLRFVVVGSEKLRDPLRQEFQELIGKELLEGYGCTELSPVVAVNSPDFDFGRDTQIGNRPGTIGLPIPGVAARVVDLDTNAVLPIGETGLLEVRGPNIMLGYLNEPERTAAVMHDGWYVTGDIASIDEDGFIKITDRLSRFSKIGGEMVPHLRVEDAISALTGNAPCAVTGIPDDRKGERLAVLYTATDATPEEVWKRLGETDLPKLWLPKLDNIFWVEALPLLGTGKLDLRGVKNKVQELVASHSPEARR